MTIRKQRLETHYQEPLKEKDITDASVFLQSIIDSDITKGKYARFLIESFLNDKFLEEDLIGGLESTIGQAIRLFDKHKSKLPINERSVYALNKETGEVLYQSPGDLWNSVKQYQGAMSGKELKKEEQEKIYRETEFIYKDEETGFQIVSPLTEDSAKWWGKGTRWCTSAEKNNRFWTYAKNAPLLILLMPASASTAGNKLQLWKNGNKIQFMDEADNEIELEYIEQNWSALERICRWLNDLQYIPEEYRTKELCELAIQKDGNALKHVPHSLITKELCKLAVKQDEEALLFVPEELRTLELYEMAVKQNRKALRWILKEHITKELCELAVQKNGMALSYVSEEYKTKNMCKLAIQQDGMALLYVPHSLITKELCELAVKQNGEALYYAPTHFITKNMCKLAIQQNGMALLYVPHSLITKELCELSVKQNGEALYYTPTHFITKNMCKLAIQQNGLTLKFISKKYKTPELCELAVKQNGGALYYAPEYLKTKELCELAVKQNGEALWHVPDKYKTKELCKLAVQQNGEALEYVLDKFKDELEQYCVKDEIFELPMDKYQETFQEIKTFFPEKHISLDYHHL